MEHPPHLTHPTTPSHRSGIFNWAFHSINNKNNWAFDTYTQGLRGLLRKKFANIKLYR
ncbi:hypothetical protein HYC85_020029 [Camellia sinensis]|uniref:Uncharacterized protein n=1 Tax=Camellia sinensis TaxID=4442 RepID=A0A7J7GPH6_CAMSI|nr:hypothetical protein HYC85_020029 [Camellia sinensis]